MRNVFAVVSSVLFLAFGAQVAIGASWYVDNAVSGGSHNGTSWANAWSSFATVNWSSIRAGDTLYISGGSSSKTYTEYWSVGAGGASGSPITIAVDGSNPSHNGTVIFDYNSCGTECTATGISLDQNYVVLTGNVNGASHIQINNLRNTGNSRSSVGIYGSYNTGVIIDHVTFTNDNNPMRFDYANGVTVRNCSITQLRGDAGIAMNASSGTFDNNLIYGNYIEPMVNVGVGGPDGIQASNGISIFKNTIKEVTSTSITTSQQHPDMMQITGNYIKVYANDFINVGDSVFDYDAWANSNPHDIWVYNNTFRIVTAIDPYPEYFRMYCSSGSIASINNVKIMNNTFIDNNDNSNIIRMDYFRGNPTATGVEIKNNIWYNAGRGTSTAAISIDNSTGFTSSSFSFDGNVYYESSSAASIRFRGTVYGASQWISANEPHGSTGQPLFVSYSPNNINNDLHLRGDAVAVDRGVSLAQYFTTDKDGVIRPQGSGWDIGAYEYSGTFAPVPPTSVTASVH
jgi:hypothetical protein